VGIEPDAQNHYHTAVKSSTYNLTRTTLSVWLLIVAVLITSAIAGDVPTHQTISAAITNADDALRLRLADDLTADLSASLINALAEDRMPVATLAAQKLEAWQQTSGGWGYGPGHSHTESHPTFADLGHTQLAIAALRRASHAGIPVAEGVFQDAAEFTLTCKNADGGFGLTPVAAEGELRSRGASHGSATAAGLAVLMTDLDLRDDSDNLDAALQGVKWLAANYDSDGDDNWHWADSPDNITYFWRLADFGSVSHFRELDGNTLRDDIATGLLDAINEDNTWGADDESIKTVLAIDALTRINRPILVNRLDTSVGDLGSNMTRWIDQLNTTTGGDSTWQRITWTSRFSTLGEAPLWIVLADDSLSMSPQTVAMIRQFVLDGGTFVVMLTQGDSDRVSELATFFEENLGVNAWSATSLRQFDGVLDAVTPITGIDVSGAMGVGGNVRLAVAVLPPNIHEDLNQETPAPAALGLMDNLAGLATSGAPEGDSPYASGNELAEMSPSKGVAVARIIHEGDWNCCPMLFTRLSDVLAGAVSIGVKEQNPVDLTEPVGTQVRLLWLTGTEFQSFSRTETENLVTFIAEGGTVFVDSATGDADFVRDVRDELDDLFDDTFLRRLDDDHPLLTGEFGQQSGSDLSSVTYTDSVTRPPAGAELEGVEIDGRIAVILSPYGVTAAAEGSPTWEDSSLATDDARRLAANVLLYVLSQPAE
jgi:hypothetical protein